MTHLQRAVLARDIDRAIELVTADLRSRTESRKRRKERPKPEVVRDDKRRDASDAAWREFVAWVRDVVWRLSQGLCEHCGTKLLRAEGEMDHSRGGAHRKEFTRIDWCRRLCRRCHNLRTTNRTPEGEVSAAYWRDHMEAVRVRRDGEQEASAIAALRTREDEMLAVMDPLRRRPSVPVGMEVR